MTESTAESLRRVAQELSALHALGRRLRDASLKATLVRLRNAPVLTVKSALPRRTGRERRVLP